MSDRQPNSEGSSSSVPAKSGAADSRQAELFPREALAELLEVEKSRVERDNKRTEVMRLFVESGDAADQRQYQYHMAALEAEKESDAREHNLANKRLNVGIAVLLFLAIIGIALSILLFYMVFWGDAMQREIALKLTMILFSAVGGYGLFTALRRWIGRFLSGQ